MSEFILEFDEKRDGFWTVCIDGIVQGAIAVDARKLETDGAQIWWFFF